MSTFKEYLEAKQFQAIKTEQQYEVLFGMDSRYHVVDSKFKCTELFAFPYKYMADDMAAALNRAHQISSCTQESHESQTQV